MDKATLEQEHLEATVAVDTVAGGKEFFILIIFGNSFGTPDGTLLRIFKGYEGSQHLKLAPKDSRGQPSLLGPKGIRARPLVR